MAGRSITDTLKALCATVKQASSGIEDPGGANGTQSSHPSAKPDERLQLPTAGARFKEDAADVKATLGALSVATAPAVSGDAAVNIGLKATTVGDAPAIEQNYTGKPDDPGTTHPARADAGEKYANYSLAEICKQATDLGNKLVASIAMEQATPKQAATAGQTPASASATPAPTPAPTPASATQEFAAGYELAKTAGVSPQDAYASVHSGYVEFIKQAHLAADLTVQHLREFAKQAEMAAEPPPGELVNPDPDASGDASPPAEPTAAANGGGPSLDALLSSAGAPGGDIGAPPSGEEGIAALVAALDELGITPEQLAEAASMLPSGGGMPADAAASPPLPPDAPVKLAAAARDYKRSGRYQIREAKTAGERNLRDKMKSHVREMLRIA